MVTTRSRAKQEGESQPETEVGAPPAHKPRARKKKEVQEPEEGRLSALVPVAAADFGTARPVGQGESRRSRLFILG